MNHLGIADRILIAADDLQGERPSFSAEELVVAAWKRFREHFGLQGYSDQYPDSNRVLSKIMGSESTLRRKGYLEKVGAKRYRLTEMGRLRVADLFPAQQGSVRLAALSRSLTLVLRRLLASRALVKFSSSLEDLNFGDVCAFWNISPRSTAQQLAVRREEADKAIEIALLKSKEGPVVVAGEVTTEDELRRLSALSQYLDTRFRLELDVIKSRRDERRY